jgi:hypothetical protein
MLPLSESHLSIFLPDNDQALSPATKRRLRGAGHDREDLGRLAAVGALVVFGP